MYTTLNDALDELIAQLEHPDSLDSTPAVTRGTLQLLRVLRESGPEAMLDQIHAAHQAALAALRVIAPSMDEAVGLMGVMVESTGQAYLAQEADLRADASRREARQ